MSQYSQADDQERSLVEQAKRGGREGRDTLLLYLLPYVNRFVTRQATDFCPFDQEDLISQGTLAIATHMDRALARETDHVVPHLLKTAFNAMRDEITRLRNPIATPYGIEALSVVSLDTPHPHMEGGTLGELIEDTSFTGEASEMQSARDDQPLHDAIRDLPERDRTLIMRHFGLYTHAPEPINAIVQGTDLTYKRGFDILKRALVKLRLSLKEAYPHYCSLTRERRRATDLHLTAKPLTAEQEERLRAAQQRLESRNLKVTGDNLEREAAINGWAVSAYLKQIQAQTSQASQEERLNRAVEEIQASGEKITIGALVHLAHVDWQDARVYVQTRTDLCMQIVRSTRSVQERIQEAYTQMQASGEKITVKALAKASHAGEHAAGDFLRSMPIVRSTPSVQERLQEAYTRMQAQGEKITIQRLREEAQVGYAARAFLQRMREPQPLSA